MWVVGTVCLLIVGAAVAAALGRGSRADPSSPLWDVAELGGTYTGIVGTLAGFSVASATFIAGLDYPRESPAFAAVIGMLLISFVVLMATAMMYSTTPDADAGDATALTSQSLSNVLANGTYLLGLSLSWLALRPLLILIELPVLADAFTWLLLSVVISGSGRLGLFAYRLMGISIAACVAIPLLGLGLPAGYRLLAARIWTGLWPATDAVLPFAFVAFAVATLGFALQSGLLFVHDRARLQRWLVPEAPRIGLAYLQTIAIAVGLLWFAVAGG